MNNGPIIVRNPRDLHWIHETISPKFSQGAPDPKNSGKHLPGENVLTVASKIQKGQIDYKKFPELKVFTITDNDEQATKIFSLSNRRLTAFRASKTDHVRTIPASFADVHGSLWKMTSKSGGTIQPNSTLSANLIGAKECRPEAWTTLGKFRNHMEAKEAKYNANLDANGHYKDQTPADRLADTMRAAYNQAYIAAKTAKYNANLDANGLYKGQATADRIAEKASTKFALR